MSRSIVRHQGAKFHLALLSLALTCLLGAGQAIAKETIVVESGVGLHLVSEGKLAKVFPDSPNGFGVSPDGEQVVLTPYYGEYSGAVLILDLASKETEVISTSTETGMWWSQIRFAPSGEQVVGRAYSKATEVWGIYTMDTDGTNIRELASEGTWPVMSSQGTLAYLSESGANPDLYVIDPSPGGKSAPRRLARAGYYGNSAGPISFSPNGQYILFPREGNLTFAISTATGKAKQLINVGSNSEWETESTILETAGPLARRDIDTFEYTELVGWAPGWVRTNQPFGEVEPPSAFEPPDCSTLSIDLLVDSSEWVSLDCTGPGLAYEIDSEPNHGEIVEFDPDFGTVGYQPDPEYVGSDSIEFHAANDDGETKPKALSINVHAAICESRSVGTEAETPLPVTLPCFGPWLEPESEEEEWEPEPPSYELVSSPTHGEALGFNSSTGELIYSPEAEFEGEDSLTFNATDSHGTSETATLAIVVGGAPSCDDVMAHTEPGERLEIDLDCLRAVGEESSFTIAEGPSHGDISGFNSEAGELKYQPDPFFKGQDSFTFQAENWAGESNEATATLDVCAKPVLEVSGEAVEPEVPGVDLTLRAVAGEPECEIGGASPEVTKLVVKSDGEVAYSEERQCGDTEDPCGRPDWEREVQLPSDAVVGTHEIRIEAEDQFGDVAKPVVEGDTTPAEGTLSQLPPEAEDSKASKGCETPKNRYGRYVFKGKVVHGTDCADILGAYPQHHTEIYMGGGENDVIRAGGEIDTIKAGDGDDRIYAGRGNDIIAGGPGDDQIVGGSGDDRIFGNDGNDEVAGTSGSDFVKGNGGDDRLLGGGTADSLFGGGGTDTLSFADAVTPGFKFGEGLIGGFPSGAEERGIYINLTEGTQEDHYGEYIRGFNGSTARFGGGVDKVYTSDGGFENVVGSAFADVIEGSSGKNLLDGSGGNDVLKGAGGDDVIYGGADSDLVNGGSDQEAGHLHGGAGGDICVKEGESEPCERELAEGLGETSKAISIGRLDPEDPEGDRGIYVRGTDGKDIIVATWDEKANEVNVTAKGSAFDTSVNGLEVSGCTIEANFAHCPSAGIQTFVVNGGGENDVLKAHGFPADVSVTLTGGRGDDNLFGGPSEDILVDGPEAGKDDLYGFGDDDTLLANEGFDRLFGSGGADLFVSSSICEGDRIKGGGDSRDNASWAQLRGKQKGESDEFEAPEHGVSVSIPTGEAGDVSRNGGECDEEGHIEDVELLEGSGGPDRLEGNEAHNIILGRGGEDELLGGGSVDSLLANNRDPNGKTKPEKEDADGPLDCGPPSVKTGSDIATVDPADLPNVENCERVNPRAKPAQARAAGIGADPTAEAPETSSDEAVIGGASDPDAIPPVAFFQLDETGGTTAEDWDGEEVPGSYEGEGVELDQQGAMEDSRGVHLDGEDGYLDLSAEWDPSEMIEECGEEETGYSVEMWVKFDGEAASREELFSRSEGDEGIFLYRTGDGKLNFSVADERESPVVSTEEAVDGGQWHHVVATIAHYLECGETFAAMSLSPEGELETTTQLTLTVEGFSWALGLDPSGTIPSSISLSENLVGAREGESGPTNLLAGSVDDVAIYGEALSEDEVQAHLLISDAAEPTVALLPPVDPEDGDMDEDGVLDSIDNCAKDANTGQEDSDADGVGDACQVEVDSDGDEALDEADNCPEDANALQEDADENGVGDACEPE